MRRRRGEGNEIAGIEVRCDHVRRVFAQVAFERRMIGLMRPARAVRRLGRLFDTQFSRADNFAARPWHDRDRSVVAPDGLERNPQGMSETTWLGIESPSVYMQMGPGRH